MPTAHQYEMHPLTEVFPPMEPHQFEALKADIAAHGLREPIALWQNRIIDGRHRYRACAELGVTPDYQFLDDDADPVAYVLAQNRARAYLTTSQRAMAAAHLSIHSPVGARPPTASGEHYIVTVDQAATVFAVSSRTVKDARKIIEYGDADMIRRCSLPASAPRSERLTVSRAARTIKLRLSQSGTHGSGITGEQPDADAA